MKSVQDYLEQIGHAHGFTLAELQANQGGVLHPAQLARGSRKGLVALVVLTVLGGLSLAGGLIGAAMFQESLGSQPFDSDLGAVKAIRSAGIVLGGFFFVCAGVSFVRWRARRAAFAQSRLEVVEGPMLKTYIQGRGIPDRYLFQVGPRRFDASRKLWELLTQGAAYRLFLVSDQLLSFAPVFADAAERAEYDREAEQFERTRDVKPSRLVE